MSEGDNLTNSKKENEAQAAEQARDIFLANMSHELRTPLNTILGLNELIIRESQEENIREYALDIRHAGHNLAALISDILDFTKLEAGEMEVSEGIYDVSSLLNDLINSISVQIRKKKLDLVLDIAQDVPYKLLGDEVHIRQIISNLLTNAVNYTEKGKVTIHLGWKDLGGDKIELELIVKDTGVGIKEEDMPRMFRAFQQMTSVKRGTGEKTGLGLAVTNRLVHLLGGTLRVDSVYGKGSAFSVKIVQTVVDREPLGDFEKQYRESLRQGEGYKQKFIAPMGRILIVDDSAMNLAVAQGLLKQTRLQIDVAGSGEECLELIQHKTYHLICLDHMMPGMDGIETLHAIRALEDNPSRDIPAIALTANAVAGARELYIKEGFQDYLTKPIEAEKFEDMLIKYLPDNIVYLTEEQEESNAAQADDLSAGIKESRLSRIGFNVSNGLKYMNGDHVLYGKVLRDFYSILTEKEEALRSFLEKDDMAGYAIIVHSLKGNARSVGADDLADEAFALEKSSKAALREEVEVRSPILFTMMKNMREGLQVYLADEDKASKETAPAVTNQQITEERWNKALKDLAGRLDDFDAESAKEKLKELKKYDRPEEDKKMLRMCEKAIRDYAFDVALDIVNAMM
jgi:CheY-like chemotaxis protein/two-component sensor histidine kinase